MTVILFLVAYVASVCVARFVLPYLKFPTSRLKYEAIQFCAFATIVAVLLLIP